MKRTLMCRRVAAWILALVMMLSLFPLGLIQPARAAELPESITYYGDRSKCKLTGEQALELARTLENWSSPDTEFKSAYLCDGDGSGMPVLAIASTGSADGISIEKIDVYGWQGGQLKNAPIHANDMTLNSGITFGTLPDGTYGFNYESFHMGKGFESYRIKNGLLITGDSYWFEDPYGAVAPAITKNGQTVFTMEKSPDMSGDDLDQIWNAISDKYAELTAPDRIVNELDCKNGSSREDMIAALTNYAMASATPEEILARLPYYGDRSKCKLTGAQALELVQTLENWSLQSWSQTIKGTACYNGSSTISVDDLKSGNFVCAYLCDGDNSGLPILVIVSEWYIEYNSKPSLTLDVLEMYGWENGRLKKNELLNDYQSSGAGSNRFGQLSDGRYAFNESYYATMGTYDFTAHHIKGGTVTRGDYYWCRADYMMPRLEKNGEVLFESSGNPDKAEEETERASEMFEELTASERIVNEINYKSGSSREEMIAALQAYAQVVRVPSYTQPQAGADDPYYDQVMQTVTAAQSGELETLYRLADGVYYAIVKNGDSFQGLLVQGKRQAGQVVWEVSRTDQEPVDQSALDALVSSLLSVSNLKLDFSRLSSSPQLESLMDYLRDLMDNMDGLTPNDPARSELASFLDGAVSALASGAVSGKNQRLEPTAKEVSVLMDQAWTALESFHGLMKEKEVSLPRTLSPTVRLFWENADLSQASELMLTDELAKALGDGQLQILLGDGSHYIQISGPTLRSLLDELGGLSIQISGAGENAYDIRFLDGQGQVVERLSQAITVGIPASGPLNTVMVSYASGSDNWGGQYEPASGTIVFETPYSGRYEVLENNLAIADVAELSDESREAISFLVSRGYMSLDGERFRPGDPLTRYEFTQALVGMFFALDRGASAAFSDVAEDNPFYPYVASAQAAGIVAGLPDGTFGGEQNITVEQMLVIAASTLLNQKGYLEPEAPDTYLTLCPGATAAGDWSRVPAALAIREGLVAQGDPLDITAVSSREQAALILYRLFLELYEVPPVALELPEQSGELPIIPIAAGCALLAAAAVAGGVVLRSKKAPAQSRKEEQQEEKK